MEGFTALLILMGLGTLAGVTLKVARSRLHARMETLRSRLGLMEATWEDKGLMSLLTGCQGTAPLTLVGRPWGPLQVRAPIPASLPLGLSLTPQGHSASLRGMQDIQVGVPDLDAHFQVQGEHPAAAIRYLREERTQRALRGLLSADPRAAVLHGEVRLTVAHLEAPGQLERTVQLAHHTARELAEATGAPSLPASPPGPSPAAPPSAPARSPETPSRALRSSVPEPVMTPVIENGVIHPRFSPGYVAGIQREHRFRRLLLRLLYPAGLAWFIVLHADRMWHTGILFSFERPHSAWTALLILSLLVFFGARFLLRRCSSCGEAIGEGYGVTRVLAKHPITCTHCGIDLQ